MGAIFGQCPLCPKKAPAKRLYGGLCSYHFGHQADDQSAETHPEDNTERHKKELLRKFFQEQVRLIPSRCENCDARIVFTAAGRSAHVCHILPKRNFESVMVHPDNRWFGCIICHIDYDDKGWTNAVTMDVWPICVKRFKKFMNLITDRELKFLPDPFNVILHSVGE